jgi:hemerythrin superfamily protein
VVSVLVEDHEEVKELFRDIETATDGKTRRTAADQVTAELVRHSVAEEMYLYPATRKVIPDGDRLADDEIQEHAEAEELLKRWEKMDGDDPEFMEVFQEMSQGVLDHIQEEEDELFPQLQQALDANEQDELGRKIQKAKKLAPTRPHPSAPDEPPMDKLVGVPTGIVDRIRDKMSGRETG